MPFNAGNILEKTQISFLGVEPNLLRNYQLYTGMVFKGASNRRV
jgi:hypothetical protein